MGDYEQTRDISIQYISIIKKVNEKEKIGRRQFMVEKNEGLKGRGVVRERCKRGLLCAKVIITPFIFPKQKITLFILLFSCLLFY